MLREATGRAVLCSSVLAEMSKSALLSIRCMDNPLVQLLGETYDDGNMARAQAQVYRSPKQLTVRRVGF
jgi:hypothetical protein